MTMITQIEDRGAATAWSPIRSHADVIALGAKDSGGIGFDDTGGELELFDLNLSKPKSQPVLIGSVKTTSRFSSLGWTHGGSLSTSYPMGILAGGMEDGTVHLWDPNALMSNQPSLVASFSQHAAGPVKALQFNSLNPTQLATGGMDGKVLITDISNPTSPIVSSPSDEHKQSGEITAVSWNTQVSHIMASASGDGTVVVWDLKSRKPWCELRGEAAGQAVADMSWNPSQGLHLVTASADDRNPVLKIWDLRATTSMPLATLSGHNQGILGISWCPHDEHLLLSCGKDNRTILWDLLALKPIADVPNDAPGASHAPQQPTGGDLFGAAPSGGLASSQQRRYNIQWSPIKRGVALTSSLDRKVQAHSVIGLATKCGRPPKWLRPSSSVSCGFGGLVVSVGSQDKIVRLRPVVEQPQLEQVSRSFEASIETTTVTEFCKQKANVSKDKGEKEVWSFMQVIFESNARQQLLDHLGFHPDAIASAANSVSGDIANGVDNMSLDNGAKAAMSKKTEEIVKNALLVGNFEAAVECCFRSGNLADALVLASCGGAELWTKTQERYFTTQSTKKPFLSMVSAVIHNQLDDLVSKSDPKKWHETLAILCTYGKSEEFPALCIALGDLLEQAGNYQSASLCHMCALNLDRSLSYWKTQLEAANKRKGSMNLLALHDFVVKVSVFLKAAGPAAALGDDVSDLFAAYAQKLSEQGLLVTAAKYVRGDSTESKILRDRLYRSRASHKCLMAMGGTAPEFPFSLTDVKQSRTNTASSYGRQHQQQQQQQQSSYVKQQQTKSNAYSQQYSQQQSHQYSQAQTQQYSQQQAQQSQQYSQQYSQQQQTQYNQSQQYSQAPAPSAALPDGWIELQDPTSGRAYFANQTTGEVTWDKPQAAPAPAPQPAPSPSVYTPAPQPAPAPAPVATTPQPTAGAAPQQAYNTGGKAESGSTPSRLASKYGDGFVSSASHPELAHQYGNVGTSNPYTTVARPGTAVFGKTPEKPPVSATYDPNALMELAAEHEPIRDCLLGLTTSLKSVSLTAVDKRQLAEAEKGVAVFLKRLARGDISGDIIAKVTQIADAVNNGDFRTALSIQTGLVNSDWKDHKDWLKGIKALLQLSSKKF